MAEQHLCVAIYRNPEQADEAFSRLKTEGTDLPLLSFVGRDYWKDMLGSRNAGERFMYRGALAPFWQRLWSVLHNWGVFWFFESGPVLVAGPLVRTIVATQEEGRGTDNESRFKAGLAATGIPDDSLAQYEEALLSNQILVFIQGSLVEIDRVQAILNETKAINHTIHHTRRET